MEQFLQATASGIAVGSIFAVAAVGLTLVYGILKLTNFAHGEFLTFGAYIGWVATVTWALPLPLGLILAAAATAALCLAGEFVVWRPLRRSGAGMLQLLLMALGMAFVIRYSLQFAFGTRLRRMDIDVYSTYELGGIVISRVQLLIVAAALVTLIGVGLLLSRTLLGKSMRALGDNPELAAASGIDTQRVTAVTWALAGALAGIGGVLAAMQLNVNPLMGFHLLLSLFAVVILGGIGSPYGALIGAYAIGLGQEWSVLVGVDPRYKLVVGFLVLVAVLLVRPTGLFGKPHAVRG